MPQTLNLSDKKGKESSCIDCGERYMRYGQDRLCINCCKNAQRKGKKKERTDERKKEVRKGGAEEGWEATIEIESSSTLEDLHFAIQSAVGFDNDHLYEFYIYTPLGYFTICAYLGNLREKLTSNFSQAKFLDKNKKLP